MNFALKILLFSLTILSTQIVYSKSNNKLKAEQAKYIFKAGQKTKAAPHSSTKYKIAIVGNNRDTKKLITYIEEELSSKRIRSRHVLFFSYREFSQVGNEDLVVFSSKTKLKTNDLDSKLLSVNYITLKETSPYGINFFNADNSILQASNTKLEEENTEQEELLQDATATIDVQKDSIVKNKKALGKKTKLI